MTMATARTPNLSNHLVRPLGDPGLHLRTAIFRYNPSSKCNASPESCRASTHDFSLADQFGVEFTAIEGKQNIKVNA